MKAFMGLLSFAVTAYMIVVFVRILLTWFSGMGTGSFANILGRITDPYLNWFKRFPALKTDYIDLSPIVALGVLSLVNRIFSTLAFYGSITLGIVLAMALQAVWGAVSFFIGFMIIVLVLRLVAHLTAQNSTNAFWHVIDAISQPVLYRINRFLFKDRITNYITSLIISIASLVIAYIVLKILVTIISSGFARLPF